MSKLDASAFLCGLTGGTFKVDLEWLIKPKNGAMFEKLLGGGYGDGAHTDAASRPEPNMPDFVREHIEREASARTRQ
jgi:hypothetical protein